MRAALWAILILAATAATVPAGDVTMLVVPARYSVLQVAFDAANRFPTVLVSYQGDASSEAPLLHAWNGSEWVGIGIDQYAAANFLQVIPNRVVLVGDEKLLPGVLASSVSTWCPNVLNVPSIDTAALVNSLSKIYPFNASDWRWFTGRYNLSLTDLNAERRRTSWYDRPSYQDDYTPRLRRVFRSRTRESSAWVVGPPSTVTAPPAEVVPEDPYVEETPGLFVEEKPVSEPVEMKPRLSVPGEEPAPEAMPEAEPAVAPSE